MAVKEATEARSIPAGNLARAATEEVTAASVALRGEELKLLQNLTRSLFLRGAVTTAVSGAYVYILMEGASALMGSTLPLHEVVKDHPAMIAEPAMFALYLEGKDRELNDVIGTSEYAALTARGEKLICGLYQGEYHSWLKGAERSMITQIHDKIRG